MQILSNNKKAYHDYEVVEEYEAGIMLTGGEVKATREGHCNLKGSHISIKDTAAWLKESHIAKYSHANDPDYSPTRARKLLLNKKEMVEIEQQIATKGITCIPLEIYLKNNIIKVKIGICKGRKKHDKREVLKKKAQNLEIEKSLKRFTHR